MNKKKWLVLAVVLTVLASISTVYAFMYKKTPVVKNEFELAQVSCLVDEIFEEKTVAAKKVWEKSSVKVQNTSNIPVYIRVTVNVYWQDTKGNPVGFYDGMRVEGKTIDPLPTLSVNNNWIHYGDNIYYYKSPVNAGEFTGEFLNSAVRLTTLHTSHLGVSYDYNQAIEIIAEAIQANPTDVVVQAWKVVLDEQSYITTK